MAHVCPTDSDSLKKWGDTEAHVADGCRATPRRGGDFSGIGILEPFWKVMEVLMDKRLQNIKFHDCLHGFLAGLGTGTATAEVKLTQQLACPIQPQTPPASDITGHQHTLDHTDCSIVI